MKYFIITIDTEGDSLWDWKEGRTITTGNSQYLDRFQQLCNAYNFKPVWLSNWEMINDDKYVKFIKKNLKNNMCELGMHLHAWNSPPIYHLNAYYEDSQPYLIEYPERIIDEKIKCISNKFYEIFGFVPKTHRAGRWAINDCYMRCLKKYGYEIDCSVTPGVDWSHNVGVTENSGGRNYKNAAKTISNIQGIIEVPVTIYYTHSYCPPDYYFDKGLIKKATRLGKSFIKSFMGRNLWLRPTGNNLTEMKKVVEMNMNDDVPYLMFMLHSSELMSGGSPTFPDVASIEKLYADLEMIFELISKNYKGVTLEEFVKKLKNNI